MNLLSHNIKTVLHFANTKTFCFLWIEKYNVEPLLSQTIDKLKLFNYLSTNLIQQDMEIMEYISQLVATELVTKLSLEEGQESQFKFIIKHLKQKKCSLNEDLNFEIMKIQNIPQFNMDKDTYDYMFQLAVASYKNSYFYKVRELEGGKQFAENAINKHLCITGEILTQLFAKDYIKSLTDKKTYNVPANYKITLSGQEYMRELKFNPLKNKDTKIIENIRKKIFKSYRKFQDLPHPHNPY